MVKIIGGKIGKALSDLDP